MGSNPKHLGVAAVAAAIASADAFWLGTGLQPVWWLVWLAPLPLLLVARHLRAGAAALVAWLAVFVSFGNQWHYLRDLIQLPVTVILISAALAGLVMALAVLLFRHLLLRARPIAAMFAFPSLWTAASLLNASTSPHGTWGDIAYTQMNALPVIQIAAVTGIWGIGFTVLLAPACLAALSARSAPWRARLAAGVIGAAIVAGALGYGAWRLSDDASDGTARIALASLPGGKPLAPADPAGEALSAKYRAMLEPLAAGAQYAVIPEVSFGVSEPDVPALREFAQQHALTLVVGVDLKAANAPERNASLAFGPGGGAPAVYYKEHLVPVFENRFTPGTETTLLGDGGVGLTICKDNDFPDLLRRYGRLDARLLLVPAWDFDLDGWLHSRMAILRGVESGFALARSARGGRLTLSDDRGRVLGEASSEDRAAQLVGDLPLRHTHTLYARFGDWFAWVCVGVLALTLGWAAVAARR